MSESYAKLFSTIATSTIWSEPLATRVVWITMLAIADRSGEVQASVPGLARVANVSMDDCLAALATFLAPDPYSRTPDNEGRRIEVVDGGWRLLNHSKYRAKLDADDRRERKAKWMAESRAKSKKSTEQQPDNSGQESPQESTASTGGQSGHITDAPTASPTRKKRTPVVPASGDVVAVALAAYHEALPLCRHHYTVTPRLAKRILVVNGMAAKLIREMGWDLDVAGFWSAYFGECANNAWLRGEQKNPNDPKWKQHIACLIHDDRFQTIMDGAIERMRAELPEAA